MANDEYHKWILFTEQEIETFCAELQGKFFDREINAYRQFRTPLINEQGVAGLKVAMKSVLSPNTLLSNIFDEEDLHKTGWRICISILGTLTLHSKQWELKPSHKQFIMTIVANYVDFALRRAYKEGERTFAKNTMTTHRSVIDKNKQPYEIVYEIPEQPPQQ